MKQISSQGEFKKWVVEQLEDLLQRTTLWEKKKIAKRIDSMFRLLAERLRVTDPVLKKNEGILESLHDFGSHNDWGPIQDQIKHLLKDLRKPSLPSKS